MTSLPMGRLPRAESVNVICIGLKSCNCDVNALSYTLSLSRNSEKKPVMRLSLFTTITNNKKKKK